MNAIEVIALQPFFKLGEKYLITFNVKHHSKSKQGLMATDKKRASRATFCSG